MDAMRIDRLGFRWKQTLAPFDTDANEVSAAFADLVTRYREPARHYHTLEHIESVLDVLAGFGAEYTAIDLAAWYHDAVYEPLATDNEERSAALAGTVLQHLGIPSRVREEVARLILLTNSHQASTDDTAGQRLLDADLSVLGAETATYDRYAAAIRQEYTRVPEADYRVGRQHVLQTFLDRKQIYFLLRDREARARENLRREIELLGVK
jgi:predicted metal-dependent HD superfamily phosphohydrolase